MMQAVIFFEQWKLPQTCLASIPRQYPPVSEVQPISMLSEEALPTMFTSLVLVNSCYLTSQERRLAGKTQKVIEGACIEGEWERLVGCIGPDHPCQRVQRSNSSWKCIIHYCIRIGRKLCVLSFSFFLYITLIKIVSVHPASSPSTSAIGRRVGDPPVFLFFAWSQWFIAVPVFWVAMT